MVTGYAQGGTAADLFLIKKDKNLKMLLSKLAAVNPELPTTVQVTS